jgi:uncharacterized HhH-GPD family protein
MTTLPFTGHDDADRLLAEDPLALLIGFALDQQVTVRIAAMDPAELDRVFRERPALHRFPGSMAGKVQALCAAIARDYGGDAARIWREARDGRDLQQRLLALPGFGEMKVRSILAILGKRLGVNLPGMADVMPAHPTLGDVDSPEALASYQAGKRAKKAELRAQGKRA